MERPLKTRRSSGSSGSASASAFERPSKIFTVGLVLFGLSWLASGVSSLSFMHDKYKTVGGVAMLLFGVLSIAGLIVMTLADLDINDYMKEHKIWRRFFLFCYIVSFFMSAIQGNRDSSLGIRFSPIFLLPILPFLLQFLLLLVRYKEVVEVRDQMICNRICCFTDLLLASFLLDLLANVIWYFFSVGSNQQELCKGHGNGSPELCSPYNQYVAAAFLPGVLCTSGVWCYSRHKQGAMYDTEGLQRASWVKGRGVSAKFKVTTYAYLLSFGFGQGARYLIRTHKSDELGGDVSVLLGLGWAFVAVHIFPPLVAWVYFRPLKQWLGLLWSGQRERAPSAFELVHPKGSLNEIEAAIHDKRDLNEWVYTDENGDKYTRLHIAASSDRTCDALQRLLITGEIKVNKATKQGKTALFIAAEEGQKYAARLLLEHNADVNALTDEGQSPIIVAALKGHREIVALLKEHGALTDLRWMGLSVNDVIAEDGNQRHESGTDPDVKRKKTERAVLRGQPGYISNISNSSSLSSASSSLYTSDTRGSSGYTLMHKNQSQRAFETGEDVANLAYGAEPEPARKERGKTHDVYVHFQSSLKQEDSPTGLRGNSLFASMDDARYQELDMRHYWYIEWLEVVRTCREKNGYIIIFDFSNDGPYSDASMRSSPNCVMELGLLYQVHKLESYAERMQVIVLTDEDMESTEPIQELLSKKADDQAAQRRLFLRAYNSCRSESTNQMVDELVQRWIADYERAGGDITMFEVAAMNLTRSLTVDTTATATHTLEATAVPSAPAPTATATPTRSFSEVVAAIDRRAVERVHAKSWAVLHPLHEEPKLERQLRKVLEATKQEIQAHEESIFVVTSFRKAFPNARHEVLCELGAGLSQPGSWLQRQAHRR